MAVPVPAPAADAEPLATDARPASNAAAPAAESAPVRLGVVNYLNTLPLIDGLSRLAGTQLRPAVPAQLIDLLLAGEVEMALCSAVDYQRAPVPLAIVPVGMLGCDGPTLTVRLYARRPFEQVRTLAADADSHTSRALAQILLRERYGATPTIVEYARDPAAIGAREPDTDAMLLIGDKVVNDAPDAGVWPFELDLGEAWHAWTGLPFVFAVWLVAAEAPEAVQARVRTLARVLDHQRRHNIERIEGIVAREAMAHGWPAQTARHYLRDLLRFDFTPRAQAGMERFFAECHRAGVLGAPQPLRFFRW